MDGGKVVSVTVRMEEETKALWKSLAEREDRSMGNYLHRLLKREAGETVTTLDTLDGKIDLILAFTKPKPRKPKAEKTAYDVELDDLISEEAWRAWIDHLHKCDRHINHYEAENQFNMLREFIDEGYDGETVLEALIKDSAKKVYLPYSIRNGVKGNDKPWWHDAK